jgi:2-polyprenyl-3-methyl-5-hydroxy-6-metoxy-1,4-benzoquinol methylase
MACCQCQGIERLFDRREALRKLDAYARHGPDRTTRLLLNAVKSAGAEGATLLDIGGGIGMAQLALLAAGALRATDVDASSAYLNVAREEARRRGYGDRVTYRHGDFVALAPEIEPADIVTLDRVICCYHDMPALVRASAAKARRLYGLVYPRDAWWTRCFSASENLVFRVRRHPYRSFIYPTRLVDTLVRRTGLERRLLHQGAFWQVVLYARPDGVSRSNVCERTRYTL